MKEVMEPCSTVLDSRTGHRYHISTETSNTQTQERIEMNKVDITNETYGSLTVIRRVHSNNNNSKWLCRCQCGRLVKKQKNKLTALTGTQCESTDSRRCGCTRGPEKQRQLEPIDFDTYIKSLVWL